MCSLSISCCVSVNGIMGSLQLMRDEMQCIEQELVHRQEAAIAAAIMKAANAATNLATKRAERAKIDAAGAAGTVTLDPLDTSSAAVGADTTPTTSVPADPLFAHLVELTANLNNIDECVQHQKVIADDVLGLSKLEHSRVALESQPFDLAECVRKSLSMYEAVCKLKKLKLLLDYDCEATHIRGDANRLKQIIANVLNNAGDKRETERQRMKGRDARDRPLMYVLLTYLLLPGLFSTVKFTARGSIQVIVSQLSRDKDTVATVSPSATAAVADDSARASTSATATAAPLPSFSELAVAASHAAAVDDSNHRLTVPAAKPSDVDAEPASNAASLAKLCEFEILVRDTGIGMSEQQISGLFQPYSQASTKTSLHYGGSGLGLCIARELARLMGQYNERRGEREEEERARKYISHTVFVS